MTFKIGWECKGKNPYPARVYGFEESGKRPYGHHPERNGIKSLKRQCFSVLQPGKEIIKGGMVGSEGILVKPEASHAQACS
jgi:hypothetical protein